MSLLYIVRHGQAGTFDENYDNLSELGHEQARECGRSFQGQHIKFNKTASGTLRRQKQTLAAIAEGSQFELNGPAELAGLNEFSVEMWGQMARQIAETNPQMQRLMGRLKSAHKTGSGRYFAYFKMANDEVLSRWMQGETADGFESFQEFRDRVTDAVYSFAKKAGNGNHLLVTSATPILLLYSHVQNIAFKDAMKMLPFIANTSTSVYHYSRGRLELATFNATSHLKAELQSRI